MATRILEALCVTPRGVRVILKSIMLEKIPFSDPIMRFTSKHGGILFILIASIYGGVCLNGDSDIHCEVRSDEKTKHGVMADLDKYEQHCLSTGTFLVKRCLSPLVDRAYPGVRPYKKSKDEIISITYYQYLWIKLIFTGIISCVPFFVWRKAAFHVIKDMLHSKRQSTQSKVTCIADNFRERIGCHNQFGNRYIICKILGCLIPPLQMFILMLFIGKKYVFYGFNYTMYLFDPLPGDHNPQDELFPKKVKCEKSIYGMSGGSQDRGGICQLSNNSASQWFLLIIWFWLTISFSLNVLSLMMGSLSLCKCIRDRECKKKLSNILEGHVFDSEGEKANISNAIRIRLSYGDWLILNLLQRNLKISEFSEFMRSLIASPNNGFRLKRGYSLRENVTIQQENDNEPNTIIELPHTSNSEAVDSNAITPAKHGKRVRFEKKNCTVQIEN